jgi:hypothetical protein
MFISVGLVGKRRRTDGQMLNRYPAMDSVDHEVSSGKKKRVAVYFHRKPAIGWNDLGSRASLWLDIAGARMHAACPWKFSGRPSTDRGRTAHRNDRALHVAPTHRSRRKGIEDGQARMVRRPVRRRHPSACHLRRGLCRRRAQLRPATCRASEPRALDLAREIWRAAW